jgi:uncharacterized membrane protein YhaH (DUF805 family)
MDFTYLFTSFSGRISRAPYWQGILILIVTSIVLTIGLVMSITSPSGGGGMLIAVIVSGLLLFAASIPLTVKRLHDRGKSGHYAWLIYGSSIVGSAIDSGTRVGNHMSGAGLIVTLITIAIGFWFFIELGFFRGTPGPNAYGPDPLEAQ